MDKTTKMHNELRRWHVNTFSNLNSQLKACKEAILFFDKIEDRRILQPYEFGLRNKLRAKVYELANISEEQWKQRSRCKWLSQGDKNTRFFHAFASSRMRKKSVMQIDHEGILLNNQSQILHTFLNHMKAVLGTESVVIQLEVSVLYPTNPVLLSLQVPISEDEIQKAVWHLASGKVSGPDGLPAEWLQANWRDVKYYVLKILYGFFEQRQDILLINRGNIIFISKSEVAQSVNEYRPISVLNVLLKFISKILSDRLSEYLPCLISCNQTAFIRGRKISENFVVTREILHHIAKRGRPTVFIKLDFAKAFDSVNWTFLLNVLKARDFPRDWIDWIEDILYSSYSRVVINGEESEFFDTARV